MTNKLRREFTISREQLRLINDKGDYGDREDELGALLFDIWEAAAEGDVMILIPQSEDDGEMM